MEHSEHTGFIKKIKADLVSLSFLGFICLSTGLFFSSCGNKPNNGEDTDTPTTGKKTIVVDATFKPIIEEEIDVFQNDYKYAFITPKYKTENEAFNDLFKDSVDVILVTRGLSVKEKKFFEDKKMFPVETKVAYDGLALIVNNKNVDTMITVKDVEKILTGQITKWSQLNPGSKLGDIKVAFDNKNSSTVRFAVDSICKGKELSPNLSALNTNPDVIDYVSKTEGAIGIMGVNWVSNKSDSTALSFLDKIKVMAISKAEKATYENSFQPFQAYIANKTYPFIRSVYMINAEGRAGLGLGFIGFVAGDKGQRIIKRAGLLPANVNIVIKVQLKDDYPQ